MKIIRLISRIFVGAVFLFSGSLKAIDPLGTTFKFEEYFIKFGMDWAVSFAFPLAIFMITLEFVVGFSLFFGFKRSFGAWGALLFMLIFTPLTFVIAKTNLVTDCGCFGDFLKMSNWGTFTKNIVIIIPTLIFFLGRNKSTSSVSGKVQLGSVAFIGLVVILFQAYTLNHLPFIDFRHFKIGNNIPALMKSADQLDETNPIEKALLDKIPVETRYPEFETTVFYKNKKTGETKGFKDDYPSDEEWDWVSTDNVALNDVYEPPVHDFSINDPVQGDLAEEVLQDDNYNFLLISYDLNKSDYEGFESAYRIAEFAKQNGYGFYCMTAGLDTDINELKNKLLTNLKPELHPSEPVAKEQKTFIYMKDGEKWVFAEDEDQPLEGEGFELVDSLIETVSFAVLPDDGFAIKFYTCDAITLKTIVRSNPGLVLIKGGTILNKWASSDMPSVEEIPGLLK